MKKERANKQEFKSIRVFHITVSLWFIKCWLFGALFFFVAFVHYAAVVAVFAVVRVRTFLSSPSEISRAASIEPVKIC